MKIELHILQNFPPANLNRDDTGTPKDCEFGGERRARISSQCIKRSIRTHPIFAETLGQDIAVRTKRSAFGVAKRLKDAHGHTEAESHALAEAIISALLSDVGDDGQTSVLYYVTPDELGDLAGKAHEAGEDKPKAMQDAAEAWKKVRNAENELEAAEGDEKKEAEQALKEAGKAYTTARKALTKTCAGAVKEFVKANQGRARSVDVALFGRMLAEKPELNLEAACQVAHAISTNRVSMEFDYYTAVDDLKQQDDTANAGAGMIGTTGYNASCFYRYMLIDVDHLASSLGDGQLAHDGVRAFLKAAIAAIPSGKQNSFAAQTRPVLVLAVVRPDGQMPMSLVNAFEKPAYAMNGTSLVAASVAKMDQHWGALTRMYGDDGYHAFLAVLSDATEEEKAVVSWQKDAAVEIGLSIPTLIDKTVAALNGEAAA